MFVVDADDDLNDFSAIPKFGKVYADLVKMQREAGGNRTASERVLKSASRFGVRMRANIPVPCLVNSAELRPLYFRLLNLKIDLLTKVFPDQYSRPELFQEAQNWLNAGGPVVTEGLRIIIFEKKSERFQSRLVRKQANE